MRRSGWSIIPILGTAALLALGAYMPQLASMAMDDRLEREITRLDDASVSLELSKGLDLFQALDLYRTRSLVLDVEDGHRMTEEEAAKAARDAMNTLSPDTGGHTAPDEITPLLLLDAQSSPSLAGYYWQCIWRGDDRQPQVMWLDDQSGLMVAYLGTMQIDTLRHTSFISKEDPARRVEEFCRNYYPVSDVECENLGGGDYLMTLFREEQDGRDAAINIPFSLTDYDMLDFND